jgi:hypothetical protein
MTSYTFKRELLSNLLLITAIIDNRFQVKIVLDSGATHTTIDSNALYLLGHELREFTGETLIETGAGVVQAKIYQLGQFTTLGITKKNFSFQVYDFLAHGIVSNYDGILGLDFLEGENFCINLQDNTISFPSQT